MDKQNSALNLFQSWLINSGFSGFKFDTNFTLYFETSNNFSEGLKLPLSAELILLENWWVGEKEDWDERVCA
jgi:hypothetical protein